MHQRKVALAGSAQPELVSGMVQLRPEDAMFDAMLRGWRAQQKSRGLKDDTIDPRERLIRRFLESTNGTRGDGRPPTWTSGRRR
ncbi:hypothetical protein [Streptomyces poonensis]|uniref:hypothetical protein n=1 Tax=Streptomyces poonensis TaxID=68255 RepID=UPI0027E4B275|nr:hypothetical protein [Streptomyces poonensis]